ncbi:MULTISPECIES: DUF1573 domain-containing protein [unclassified Flavobacterium]|jgi:hypothetical protein|uniref:DUF1573 domain-containing protein n=1 Tax=unclassified Flavobacterium TaxID=196869 RepID=UPI001F1380A9|nr:MULTISPECIES: DUF1573 domain-containing protein [unclassified Flavobacterium]UMY66755.1 DUF1573 domain-containing protein [Flavobacterium sp. HJ-32-4]HLN95203.1 DUF1573 domain-containing protein [Flavobacterium sp.]
MKKNIFLLSVLSVFALTTASAQESSKKTVTKKQANTTVEAPKPAVTGPGIVFENETIDYGTIEFKADGKREFVFTNNGTEPLIIKNAQGSCGCTVPTWPKDPIAPGAKGVIGVKYATERVGSFTKTVTLTTNASETPKVLTIKGTVKPDPNAAQPAPAAAPATKS